MHSLGGAHSQVAQPLRVSVTQPSGHGTSQVMPLGSMNPHGSQATPLQTAAPSTQS
jgi:hypothetical protein